MDNKNAPNFDSLDFSPARHTSVPTQTVEVKVEGALFDKYAKAFVDEAYRKNPLRAEQVQLTQEEVCKYVAYLVTKRIETVHSECRDFRRLKALYIPAWIQYNLRMIGEVTLRDRGLRMIPVEESPSTMTFEEAVEISNKIGYFLDDLQIFRDAMPRSIEGDKDVMSTALIADHVCSLSPVEHVAATYASAFMGMKLREELMFKILYRIQYDDFEYIASVLTTQRGLF